MSGARGRPSLYTPEIAAEICQRLSDGEALDTICQTPGMPVPSAVRKWAIEDREGFYAEYARARDLQADAIAEKAVAEALVATDAQLARLAFDARKWQASKLAPKRYGDKLQHTGDGGGAVTLNIVTGVPRDEPD